MLSHSNPIPYSRTRTPHPVIATQYLQISVALLSALRHMSIPYTEFYTRLSLPILSCLGCAPRSPNAPLHFPNYRSSWSPEGPLAPAVPPLPHSSPVIRGHTISNFFSFALSFLSSDRLEASKQVEYARVL
jgi:hypothetical protein